MIVRAFDAPGSERIIENMFNSEGDEYRRYDVEISNKIGRVHVWTPVTLIYLVCRLLLEKKKKKNKIKNKKKKKNKIDTPTETQKHSTSYTNTKTMKCCIASSSPCEQNT